MIKYYAYFNHGGYKDFYLGSPKDDVEFKYFLPLLIVHEQSLVDNPDDELRTSVERQKQLPKLIALSDQTVEYNYPRDARLLMSHSGYKVLYKRLTHSYSVLALRDISGTVDSFARQTPFSVMFIGENVEDMRSLDIIAEYIRSNIPSVEKELNSFFENDFVENGLKFNIHAMNAYMERIIATGLTLSIDETLNKPVRLLVIPTDLRMENALQEQKLSKNDVSVCYRMDGALVYKAVIQQEPPAYTSDNRLKPHEKSSDKPSLQKQVEQLYAMFDIPKREDIKKLWDYIQELEKRISNLENNK